MDDNALLLQYLTHFLFQSVGSFKLKNVSMNLLKKKDNFQFPNAMLSHFNKIEKDEMF